MCSAATIAIADHSDLQSLADLAVEFRDQLRQAEPSRDGFAASFDRLLADPASEFLIARTHDGEAIGYVQCRYRYSAWTMGYDLELEDLFVRASARRRQVGRRLVEFALRRARERGCRIVGLNTNEGNAPALALYESLGFRAERAIWLGGRQLWLELRA